MVYRPADVVFGKLKKNKIGNLFFISSYPNIYFNNGSGILKPNRNSALIPRYTPKNFSDISDITIYFAVLLL